MGMTLNAEVGFVAERKKRKERCVQPPWVWRIWVDTERRVISFHEEPGARLLEFRSLELFQRCIDRYTAQQYRYQ